MNCPLTRRFPRFGIDPAELQDVLSAIGAATYVLGFFEAIQHALARLFYWAGPRSIPAASNAARACGPASQRSRSAPEPPGRPAAPYPV